MLLWHGLEELSLSAQDQSNRHKLARWHKMIGHRTYYQEVVGSTPGLVAIKWLLLRWVSVCGLVNHLGQLSLLFLWGR